VNGSVAVEDYYPYISAGNVLNKLDEVVITGVDVSGGFLSIRKPDQPLAVIVVELEPGVEKASLGAALDAGAALAQTAFTTSTWTEVADAAAAAQAVFDDPDATQDEVDGAAQAVADAIGGLTRRGDTAALSVLASVGALLPTGPFTPASVDVFQAALDAAAGLVADNSDANQAQVDAAFAALRDAIAGLEPKPVPVVKAGLESALAAGQAQVSKTDAYTAESLADLQDAIDDATDVLDDQAATQAEVDAAAQAVQDAIGALVVKPVPVSKDTLAALLAVAGAVDGAVYTDDSVLALQAVIGDAQEVLGDPAATQADVDAAVAALQAALAGLELKPVPVDKSALAALVDLTQATYDSANAAGDYTAGSYAAFKAAFEAAVAELADTGSTTQSVADTLLALAAANNALAQVGQVQPGTATITGTPEVGATVAVATAGWTPVDVTFTYQWLLGGVPVVGATGSTYTPQASDAGQMLTVVVTGSAVDYRAASATSVGVPVTETQPPARKYERFALSPDLSGDGRGDILAVQASNGALVMFTTKNTGQIAATKTLVASGLSGHRVFGPGDWNGDGKADVITVDAAGRMWLRTGNGFGVVAAPVQCGRGWASYRIVPAGDLNGDGANDLLAIDADGKLWLYAGNGYGGFQPGRLEVGHGWGGFELYAAGDLNGDGKADILGVSSAGLLYSYLGRGDGTFQSPVRVGQGWGAYTLASGGDLDGDGRADVVGRNDSTGDAYLYLGKAGGVGFNAGVKIATGW
jgi:hypothetical protein